MLVIDVGTTSVKVVLYADYTPKVNAECRLTLYSSSDGGAEQDPDEVYMSAKGAMISVLRSAQAEGITVQGVGFSAAMHSLIPISHDNRALGRAMTWLDRRAASVEDQLKGTDLGQRLYVTTGTPIHAMSPALKLLWMRRQKPEMLGEAAKFVSLKEWIWFNWFGIWEIDESMASATGLYDLERRQWSESALSATGVRTDQLSALRPTSFVRCGCSDEELLRAGLPPKVTFNIGATDGTLANLGSGAIDSTVATLTVGTSLAVRVTSEERFGDPRAMPFCYVLDDDHYVCGQPSNSGGAVLEWVWELLADEKISLPMALDEAAQSEIEDLYCLPYLFGERAPLWRSTAKAALVGLQKHHRRSHITRAALEGVFLNAYWAASSLFADRAWPRVFLVSGKIFESPRIAQLLADVLGTAVCVQPSTDTSVYGALVLARKAIGMVDSSKPSPFLDIGSGESAITYWPRDHARYVEKFKTFRALASACLEGT